MTLGGALGFLLKPLIMLRSSLPVLALLIGCAESTPPVSKPQVAAEGPQLWVQVAGQGEPTVVFESGEGDDSSVWEKVEAQVRLSNGVRTVLYDRAGLGNSSPAAGPYRIDDEAAALKRALDRFGIKGPIVLVAHSYGGFVATMLATTDPRIAGVVFVDAYVREMFDDASAAHLVAKTTPLLDALRRSKPAVANAMGPVIRAFPDTARRMRGVPHPPTLPTIDIVAESWGDTPQDSAALRRAHTAFVAGSPEREEVIATGSGHHVMRDRPDVVIDAIARIVRRVRGR
jgi:pimeloyl-ACP methyl ester carboxylesterase